MIVVTGASGQLGHELKKILGDTARFLTSQQLNLQNLSAIQSMVEELKPSLLINAAAYTAVDKAESEPDIAKLVNADAPGEMARLAHEKKFRFVHLSTDYVFDGKAYEPYKEDHAVRPVNAYGKSKADGEAAVLKADPKALIVRSSWLYSAHGKNFVKTVLRIAQEKPSIRVVFDQIGSLTSARDLAQVLLKARDLSGIYHYSNEGVGSWYDVACAIRKICKLSMNVEAILTKDYPTPAARPAYSVLNKTKIKTDLNLKIPHWMESLEQCLKELS